MTARLEKTINYFVGLSAIILLVGAGVLLFSTDSTIKTAKTTTKISTDSTGSETGLLGATNTLLPKVNAAVKSQTPTGNGSTRIEISATIENVTENRIEFSPPIDLFVRDKFGKQYQLESNPQTTLLGGPLEAAGSQSGSVFVVIDSTVNASDISLFYQPNSSPDTIRVNL